MPSGRCTGRLRRTAAPPRSLYGHGSWRSLGISHVCLTETSVWAGIALPFLLLGFVPVLRRVLPRPGPWLATFRHIMAIPMLRNLSSLGLGARPPAQQQRHDCEPRADHVAGDRALVHRTTSTKRQAVKLATGRTRCRAGADWKRARSWRLYPASGRPQSAPKFSRHTLTRLQCEPIDRTSSTRSRHFGLLLGRLVRHLQDQRTAGHQHTPHAASIRTGGSDHNEGRLD